MSPAEDETSGVWCGSRPSPPTTATWTTATWLLSFGRFVSLGRNPHGGQAWGRPLADLDRDLLLRLSRQRAGAGHLVGGTASPVTRYVLDFQGGACTPEPTPPVLRTAGTAAAVAAVALRDPRDGRTGMLLRCGSWFAYARDRTVPLTSEAPLAQQVLGCRTTAEAVAMLDCEVSIGRIDRGSWLITSSTLPHRSGQRPRPELCGSMFDQLRIEDLAPDGRIIARSWQIIEAAGLLHTLSAIERADMRAGGD